METSLNEIFLYEILNFFDMKFKKCIYKYSLYDSYERKIPLVLGGFAFFSSNLKT